MTSGRSARPLATRRRRGLALLLTALLLPLAAPSALASSPSGDRTLAAEAGRGSRWTAGTVLTDGARVTSRLDVSGATAPLALSARLYVDGQRRSTTNVVIRSGDGARGVRVEAPDVAGLRLSVDQTQDESGFRLGDVALTSVVNPDGPVHRGRVSLVLYAAASEVELWRWTLTGAPGTAPLGGETGAEAFAYSAKDFGGSEVSVYAGTAVPDVGTATVRSNTGASRPVALNPRFIGSYTTAGTDRLRVTGPFGYARDCPGGCAFDLDGGRISVPGTYSFHLDGTSTGLRGPGGVSIADTDISLHGAHPRPPAGGAF